MMRIGIDIRPLGFLDDKAGIYQYIDNLISNLLSVDHQNDYTLLSTLKGSQENGKIPNRRIKRVPGRLSEFLLEGLTLPVEILMGELDLFHGPCFFVPRHLRGKSIVTIHDLMMFRAPEFLNPEWAASLKKKVHASVKRADAIIAVSEFTKKDMGELLHISEERIRVIHNGIDSTLHPIKDKIEIEKVKVKYGVKGPYLLFVGNIEPKKNIERLIHACVKLQHSTRYKYPLLVVGKKAWHFQKVWEVVRQVHAENDTVFTDVVDGADLPYLYSGAELFIFPSLFEGFGIPVIEAMACGTPVVASNRTSIPEVSGDAAVIVDPMNVDELAGAIYQVLSTPALREKLIERGIERARYFSWEKSTRETLKLYQEIGENRQLT